MRQTEHVCRSSFVDRKRPSCRDTPRFQLMAVTELDHSICSGIVFVRVAKRHRPRMSPARVEVLRRWTEVSHTSLRAMLPADVSFMGLQLHITEDVFPVDESVDGDRYHQAVASEVRQGLRVLDMGTGSGVSALLAAR